MQLQPNSQKENRQELLEMILIMMLISNSALHCLQNSLEPASLYLTLGNIFFPDSYIVS